MLKKKIAITALTAAAALLAGSALAATTTISNGTLTARINDAGTFADSVSDPAGSPDGSPGLSYGGVEFVNRGTPMSWYWFQNSAGDSVASLGSNPLSATTYGAGPSATVSMSFGALTFVQTIAITAPNVLSVNVGITNNGADMRGVRWGVGFDPDQGISLGGSFDTDNTILGQGAVAAVLANYGGHSVTLRNTTSAGATSVAAYIDPFSCCSPVDPLTALSAGQSAGYNLFGDNSISLAYDIGTLGAGQTASIGYEYVFAVPEPGTYGMLLAGLGLIGAIARRRLRA